MSNALELSFDPNTIKHLGVSLYSQLSSVLAELISNSWDADAENISIEFIDNGLNKEIIYKDDGHGMTLDELNNKYLVIGRNRRETDQKSPNGRKPIGKKGLGKLSVFGICDSVTIQSVKNNLRNCFTMDLKAILASNSGTYIPDIHQQDFNCTDVDGTIITLHNIRRKSGFNIDDIGASLAKKFTIFDKISVNLIDQNQSKNLIIDNTMKFNSIDTQFEWDFPETELSKGYDYEKKSDIQGKILTSSTPIKSSEMRGIYLVSRGKVVNNASFYDLRDNDQFHSYVTGFLSVDFIDDNNDDLISTDRQSLNWEHDTTKELKEYLQEIIKAIAKEWRTKRADDKKKKFADDNIKIDIFLQALPKYQKELGERILDPILSASNVDYEMAKKVARGVMAKFENEDYKQYADSITSLSISDNDKVELLSNFVDWEIVENKQYASLIQTRIAMIEKFEGYLQTYTKEVPVLHNFLKAFPWLIDPRILEFKDEVHYSQILKENFPEDKLEESNKRIDFLCTNFLGGVIYIIEIKHSHYQIDDEAIEQAYDYQLFIREQYQTKENFNKVVAYVVGGSIKNDRKTQGKMSSYFQTGEVYVKTYAELLEQSKVYHKEFWELHKDSSIADPSEIIEPISH